MSECPIFKKKCVFKTLIPWCLKKSKPCFTHFFDSKKYVGRELEKEDRCNACYLCPDSHECMVISLNDV